MNISRVNSVNNNFKGLLTIVGPDKESAVTINTDNVSTIVKNKYIEKKEDATLGVGFAKGAVISMNSGTNINTYLPAETIIDAYKKANENDSYQVESKFNPLLSRNSIL